MYSGRATLQGVVSPPLYATDVHTLPTGCGGDCRKEMV